NTVWWATQRKIDRLGSLNLADLPDDVARIDSMTVAQKAARHHGGSHVVLLKAEGLSFEVFGTKDSAVGANEQRRMAERPRQECWHQGIGIVLLGNHRRRVAERNFADIERRVGKRPPEG